MVLEVLILFFAPINLHHLEVLPILDLLGHDVVQKLHTFFPLYDGGQVVILHLLVVAVPLAQLGQVHDE